jgi:hypothetical protein
MMAFKLKDFKWLNVNTRSKQAFGYYETINTIVIT